MLTYNKINPLFIVIVLILSGLIYTSLIPWWSLLLTIIVYLSLLAIGAVFIQYQFYIRSACRLNDSNFLLFTFDDGPHPVITPQILDLLDQYKIKAVFFMIGSQIEKYPDIVESVYKRGHQIGNHSYSHSVWFDLFSVRKMSAEVEKTNRLIEEIIQNKVRFFRPPFGVTNPLVARMIRKTGMKSVGWSFRSFDGGSRSKERIIKYIHQQIRGGEILLFHDNRMKTIEILKEILPDLSSRFNLNSNLEMLK